MYLKLLEIFILKTLFHKGEYVFSSKDFNPIKVFSILLLVINVIFTIYLLVQFSKIHDIIEKKCPQILVEKPEKKEVTKPIKLETDKKT